MATDSEGKNAAGKSINKVKDNYKSIDKKLKIDKEDSLPVLIAKILGRILLVILLIILSPFLVVGLILAMAAAL